ncbi:formylglycine-generating enzyme family protein [Pelagibius sp.]|uniref:formylglycine-generating enzyme family protein n=1 Tax=Pelagibius sp. TaxID=1931238 RepID=UPI003B50E571
MAGGLPILTSRRVLLGGMTALAALPAAALAGTGGWRVPEVIAVPAGSFIAGSDRAEREAAYLLDEAAYGHRRTREGRWYEGERDRGAVTVPGFAITRTPITNRLYAAFVAASGHPAPDVDPRTWAGYGLIHPYERTRRHAWRGDRPPPGREDHPVVLVSHGDAEAFAAWLSAETGRSWRLPGVLEWEKAARGDDGRRFPWGDAWDPARLNSHDQGPFDTLPVGRFPAGASPYGLLDAAGQVFEWTASPQGEGRFLVKGGSWDDSGCGVCRPAAQHSRPRTLKHILIGFRLIVD